MITTRIHPTPLLPQNTLRPDHHHHRHLRAAANDHHLRSPGRLMVVGSIMRANGSSTRFDYQRLLAVMADPTTLDLPWTTWCSISNDEAEAPSSHTPGAVTTADRTAADDACPLNELESDVTTGIFDLPLAPIGNELEAAPTGGVSTVVPAERQEPAVAADAADQAVPPAPKKGALAESTSLHTPDSDVTPTTQMPESEEQVSKGGYVIEFE